MARRHEDEANRQRMRQPGEGSRFGRRVGNRERMDTAEVVAILAMGRHTARSSERRSSMNGEPSWFVWNKDTWSIWDWVGVAVIIVVLLWIF